MFGNIEDIVLDNKRIRFHVAPDRTVEIAWYPFSSKIDLWIDGVFLSFRADGKVYEKVVKPLILGDREISDVLTKIAAKFRSEKTHEKYVRILAEFGVKEAARWLNVSPVKYFIKTAEVKAFEGDGRWIAGVRKPWGSVFMAKLNSYRRAFIVRLEPRPTINIIDKSWYLEERDAIIAVKLAEDTISFTELEIVDVGDTCLSKLAAFKSEDVLSYLHVDTVLVYKMFSS